MFKIRGELEWKILVNIFLRIKGAAEGEIVRGEERAAEAVLALRYRFSIVAFRALYIPSTPIHVE